MSVIVANSDLSLSGKTLLTAEGAATISGLQTFSRGGNAPFAVNAGAGTVTNLDADKLGAIAATNYARWDGTGTPGGKIAFPAAQSASTDVNTLDDYEEGSFTLTLTAATPGSPTYTNRTGYYIKIGKQVTINGLFTLLTKGGITGTLSLTGLPFTAENSATNYAPVVMPYFQNLLTNKVYIGGFIAQNTSTITLISLAAAGTSTTTLADTDIANTFEFVFQATYRASA